MDKRFKSMFKHNKFKIKYTINKRGGLVKHTSTQDLKWYYELWRLIFCRRIGKRSTRI